jgi:hypothetical protein
MQNLLIPETVKTVTASENVLHSAEAKVVSTESSRINGGYLLECFERSLKLLDEDPKLQVDDDGKSLKKAQFILSSPATNRPHVFVGKVVDDTGKKLVIDYVNNVASFRELLEALEVPQIVSTYCGTDASQVTVLTARIPEGWVARVPYVRLRHVPQIYKHQGKVVLKEIGSTRKEEGDRECLPVCRELYPVWTNRKNGEIPADVIKRAYNYITFKIDNATQTIKRWNPGLDKNSAPVLSFQDAFVLVGLPHERENKGKEKSILTEKEGQMIDAALAAATTPNTDEHEKV